jgi:hypothetical protein
MDLSRMIQNHVCCPNSPLFYRKGYTVQYILPMYSKTRREEVEMVNIITFLLGLRFWGGIWSVTLKRVCCPNSPLKVLQKWLHCAIYYSKTRREVGMVNKITFLLGLRFWGGIWSVTLKRVCCPNSSAKLLASRTRPLARRMSSRSLAKLRLKVSSL